ncbi:tRNA glutamyl-Q(34) synthetase GluQRS [Zavarzinia sp. CC-PAN008]|uniref:tRNA glutamyl-Q(34) synthetase GluQRS n=1 Tax=Zavarzinia sp. CC-PAN008 TaxID=3243332 RepID=UPI003F745565
MPTTRFAPSPTGLLHLGHAFAALFAHAAAGPGGSFHLRIEDLDTTRCRPEFEAAIHEDLAWLGLAPAAPVFRQSERAAVYAAALDRLAAQGLLYPCFCTRAEIAATAPHGLVAHYPGTCRGLSPDAVAARRQEGRAEALRLDVAQALSLVGAPLHFVERSLGTLNVDPALLDDVVLSRKEVPAAYHLAVVVDDAAQGITLVTRGEDLLPATHLHRLLQAVLGLPVPEWHHHRLILDASGRRLAKRDRAATLRALREGGTSATVVRACLGFD